MKYLSRFFFVSLLVLFFNSAKSQICGTCSLNITSLDSSSYVVNSGETFCVDTTGNFIGTINLNGGTICNKGIFNPKVITFTSGSISNYGNTSLSSSVTLGSASQILNNADAIMNINGAFTNGGGNLTNDGIINIDQSIQNNSGSITNSSIINCLQITGSGSLINTGKINSN